jgi:hypothetical protein
MRRWCASATLGLASCRTPCREYSTCSTRPSRGSSGRPGGLGIGLALARRLVEMHEGRIDIRSPGLGQGTEVEIHLPITAVPGEQLAADEHPAVPVRHNFAS